MDDILNVFKSEIYKITKRKSLYVTLFFASILPIFKIVSTIVYLQSKNLAIYDGFEAFGFVDSTWFPIVAGVFISGCIGEDYTSEGIKQIASCGIPRRKFIVGQWLAMTVFLSVVCLILGGIYCLILTSLNTFGDYSTVTIGLKVLSEILIIGVLVSFTQTVMHITKSNGTAIAVIVVVFAMSGIILLFVSDLLHGLEAYWLTNVMENATDISKSMSTRITNLVYVLIYQGLFIYTSILAFKRKQI